MSRGEFGVMIGATFICKNCGNNYTKTTPNQKYCSTCGKILQTKARGKASAKFNQSNYDRLEMKVPKGNKSSIVDHAHKQGESLNQFLNRAVTTQIAIDNTANIKENSNSD